MALLLNVTSKSAEIGSWRQPDGGGNETEIPAVVCQLDVAIPIKALLDALCKAIPQSMSFVEPLVEPAAAANGSQPQHQGSRFTPQQNQQTHPSPQPDGWASGTTGASQISGGGADRQAQSDPSSGGKPLPPPQAKQNTRSPAPLHPPPPPPPQQQQQQQQQQPLPTPPPPPPLPPVQPQQQPTPFADPRVIPAQAAVSGSTVGASHSDAAPFGSPAGDRVTSTVESPAPSPPQLQPHQAVELDGGQIVTWESEIAHLQTHHAKYVENTKWRTNGTSKAFKLTDERSLSLFKPRPLPAFRAWKRFEGAESPSEDDSDDVHTTPPGGSSGPLGLGTSHPSIGFASAGGDPEWKQRRPGNVAMESADRDPACAPVGGGASALVSNDEFEGEMSSSREQSQRPSPPPFPREMAGKSEGMGPPPGLPTPPVTKPPQEAQAAAAAAAGAATMQPAATAATGGAPKPTIPAVSTAAGLGAPPPSLPPPPPPVHPAKAPPAKGGALAPARSTSGGPARQGPSSNQKECKQQ